MMNKTQSRAFMFLIFCVGFVCCTVSADEPWVTYNSSDNLFSIEHLDSWLVKEDTLDFMACFVSPSEKNGDNLTELLGIRRDTLPANKKPTMEQIVAGGINAMKKSVARNEDVDGGVILLNGEKVGWAAMALDRMNPPSITIQYYFKSGRFLYILTYIYEETKAEFYLPIFGRMVSSFSN